MAKAWAGRICMQMPVSSYRDLIIRPLLQPLMSRLFGLVKSARYLYTLSRMAEDTAVADLQAALNTFSRDASEGLQMLASLVLASDDGHMESSYGITQTALGASIRALLNALTTLLTKPITDGIRSLPIDSRTWHTVSSALDLVYSLDDEATILAVLEFWRSTSASLCCSPKTPSVGSGEGQAAAPAQHAQHAHTTQQQQQQQKEQNDAGHTAEEAARMAQAHMHEASAVCTQAYLQRSALLQPYLELLDAFVRGCGINPLQQVLLAEKQQHREEKQQQREQVLEKQLESSSSCHLHGQRPVDPDGSMLDGEGIGAYGCAIASSSTPAQSPPLHHRVALLGLALLTQAVAPQTDNNTGGRCNATQQQQQLQSQQADAPAGTTRASRDGRKTCKRKLAQAEVAAVLSGHQGTMSDEQTLSLAVSAAGQAYSLFSGLTGPLLQPAMGTGGSSSSSGAGGREDVPASMQTLQLLLTVLQDPVFDTAPWGPTTGQILAAYIQQLVVLQGGTQQQLHGVASAYLSALRAAVAAAGGSGMGGTGRKASKRAVHASSDEETSICSNEGCSSDGADPRVTGGAQSSSASSSRWALDCRGPAADPGILRLCQVLACLSDLPRVVCALFTTQAADKKAAQSAHGVLCVLGQAMGAPLQVRLCCGLLQPEANLPVDTRVAVLQGLHDTLIHATACLEHMGADESSLAALWPEEAIGQLLFVLAHDASVKVRRACMQLVPLITLPGNSSCAHRLLTLLLAKARDKDGMVSSQALSLLAKLPLHALLQASDARQQAGLLSVCLQAMASGQAPPPAHWRDPHQLQADPHEPNEAHDHADNTDGIKLPADGTAPGPTHHTVGLAGSNKGRGRGQEDLDLDDCLPPPAASMLLHRVLQLAGSLAQQHYASFLRIQREQQQQHQGAPAQARHPGTIISAQGLALAQHPVPLLLSLGAPELLHKAAIEALMVVGSGSG